MAAKKTGARKASSSKAPARKKAATKKASPAKKAPAKKKAPAAKASVSSLAINLGHVFSLRPRVAKSFRDGDFRKARVLLQDEVYATVEEAARAVVEKALELTHEGGSKRGSFKQRR
ncbi:MAG: hypothetical protein QNK03_19585 [Myxococcota bacterium]|nr:hypothetical protein [Myxococcota bacterium]